MAQAGESAQSYYEKNKEALDEMKKKKGVKSLLAQQQFFPPGGPGPVQVCAQTAGRIQNNTKAPLSLSAHKDWSGEPKLPYAQVIDDHALFIHASQFPLVDSGAVVYETRDSASAWLLAWSVSDDQPNKVYVEAGQFQDLIDWEYVKGQLNASRDMSYYQNTITGTQMFASIDPVEDLPSFLQPTANHNFEINIYLVSLIIN